MARRHFWVRLFGVLVLAMGACNREPEVVGAAASSAPSAPAKPPVDRLAPDELLPGTEQVFGLPLPRGLRLERKFPDAAHAVGDVPSQDLIEYVSRHVTTPRLELVPPRAIFAKVGIRGQPADRVYDIEISATGPTTRLVVRDVTPPPAPQGASEAELWRKAGLTPDGRLLHRDDLR